MQFDILIIGGGINGAGIARDAAGRGASVLLLEQGDLAGATSSAPSKLIHGGLRYLEHLNSCNRSSRCPALEPALLTRLVAAYCTHAQTVLGSAARQAISAGISAADCMRPSCAI